VVDAVPCCQRPETLTNSPSPFTRIVALGFYDGPTFGVLRCNACQSDYKFDMLAWDETHEVRVFRLGALPSGTLEQCVQVLGTVSPPQWPVWVPMPLSLEHTDDSPGGDLVTILARSQPAGLIVAWQGYGATILAGRRVAPQELQSARDWFSLNDPGEGSHWFSMLGLHQYAAELVTGSSLGAVGPRESG
jgi:hypothetical protein